MPKLTEDQRRQIIRTAAVRVGISDGLTSITHGNVAKRCTVQTSAGTVRRLYPTKEKLWGMAINNDETDQLRVEAVALGFA